MSVVPNLNYALRILPSYLWQTATRRVPSGHTHVVVALADHFEPSYSPEDRRANTPRAEQKRKLEDWCREYPTLIGPWRDNEGRPFVHTYFYPAEQYVEELVEQLAEHCHAGWGEIEIHLHHGIPEPDTAENTRKQLVQFRDVLAYRYECLCLEAGSNVPRYAFVHGNFALANSAKGNFCGVDSEMQILADTGCYADMTLPTAPLHPSQTSKINSLYECALPLDQRAPQRKGHDLRRGILPQTLPLMVQGPLLFDFGRGKGGRKLGIENGAITRNNPLSLRRWALWKRAGIRVQERPDWLFIKLHCHGMDPGQKDSLLGEPMLVFLRDLVEGAAGRNETLHFVSAREMVNIILAACDGREGNPGDYRDYRLKRLRDVAAVPSNVASSSLAMKG